MFKGIFGKKKKHNSDKDKKPAATSVAGMAANLPGMAPDEEKMGWMQRLAWKQFQKMSPEKQREVVKKAMTPENVAKHRAEIIAQMDQMKAAGMMSDDQYRMAKRRLGIK